MVSHMFQHERTNKYLMSDAPTYHPYCYYGYYTTYYQYQYEYCEVIRIPPCNEPPEKEISLVVLVVLCGVVSPPVIVEQRPQRHNTRRQPNIHPQQLKSKSCIFRINQTREGYQNHQHQTLPSHPSNDTHTHTDSLYV